ncbi:sulfotransferase [Acetobacteraceae bacterium KSS8]|uniref:Sulfotransferase n=1 Tax=Endosaccharibacter trunci TaxID=2812733 RepID=A0ABT1W9L5_9PROT|nr:sulfotransferase [Acetobacteraceae bacterium KSS8]
MTASDLSMLDRIDALKAVATRQLFFVGGAPRSGTTWLQHLLDGHPSVSCRGEGLFWRHLAVPLDAMIEQRGQAIDGKNRQLFAHTGGYPLPEPGDADTLLGAGVLAALGAQLRARPDGGADCRAVGEKTPENVFLFARLKRLFPAARLIAIARDPRDVIASAWHMFARNGKAEAEVADRKLDFVRRSLDSMDNGLRTMLRLADADPDSCAVVTYEALHRDTHGTLGFLLRFLGVEDDPALVASCTARSDFETLTGGRKRGEQEPDAFLRQGRIAAWHDTLDAKAETLILDALGWSFPRFGWTA